MDIRGNGVTFGDVAATVARVSAERYDGNVILDDNAHALLSGGRSFRGRLKVKSSRGPGARRSWSGRRMPVACWHAYRDVMAAVFAEHPDARIRTSMANYVGRAGFEDLYPGTAYINVGSQVSPAYMPDLCECAETSREETSEPGRDWVDVLTHIDTAIESWSDAYRSYGAGDPLKVG